MMEKIIIFTKGRDNRPIGKHSTGKVILPVFSPRIGEKWEVSLQEKERYFLAFPIKRIEECRHDVWEDHFSLVSGEVVIERKSPQVVKKSEGIFYICPFCGTEIKWLDRYNGKPFNLLDLKNRLPIGEASLPAPFSCWCGEFNGKEFEGHICDRCGLPVLGDFNTLPIRFEKNEYFSEWEWEGTLRDYLQDRERIDAILEVIGEIRRAKMWNRPAEKIKELYDKLDFVLKEGRLPPEIEEKVELDTTPKEIITIEYITIPQTEYWEGDGMRWDGSSDNTRSGQIDHFYISERDYELLSKAKSWTEVFEEAVGMSYAVYSVEVLEACEDGDETYIELDRKNRIKAKNLISAIIEFKEKETLPLDSSVPEGWKEIRFDGKKRYLIKER